MINRMALQYEDEEKRFEMSSFFNVNGIPAFMILDGETGNVVTTNGRNDIQACNGDHSVLFEAWCVFITLISLSLS